MRGFGFAVFFLVLGVLGVLITPAYGGLIGATVDVAADYPTMGTVYVDGGAQTVNGTVEWPAGSFSGYSNTLSVQITDTQIIVSLNGTGESFGPAVFNGLDIDAITGSITSAVVDSSSSSGFDPVITLAGANLYLNYQSDSPTGSDLSIIDYTGSGGSTPEPASLALIGTGLLALGLKRIVSAFR